VGFEPAEVVDAQVGAEGRNVSTTAKTSTSKIPTQTMPFRDFRLKTPEAATYNKESRRASKIARDFDKSSCADVLSADPTLTRNRFSALAKTEEEEAEVGLEVAEAAMQEAVPDKYAHMSGTAE